MTFNLPIDNQIRVCVCVIEPVCAILVHAVHLVKPQFRFLGFDLSQFRLHSGQCWLQFGFEIALLCNSLLVNMFQRRKHEPFQVAVRHYDASG